MEHWMDSQTLYKAGMQPIVTNCARVRVCMCTNKRAHTYVFKFIPCQKRPCSDNGIGCVDGGADVVELVVVLGVELVVVMLMVFVVVIVWLMMPYDSQGLGIG